LFKHEVATLQLLIRVFQGVLTPEQIKMALVVLLQHDCVFVEHPPQQHGGLDVPSSSSAGKGVNYRINRSAVINRLRHPSLLLIIRSTYGDVGVFIMECFIEHGHMNLAHLGRDAIAARRLDAGVELMTSSSSLSSLGDADDETVLKEMRTAFEAMIEGRYLCPVPHFTPRKSALQEQQQRVVDACSTRRVANPSSSIMPVARRAGAGASSSGVAFGAESAAETVVRRKRAATPMARGPSSAGSARGAADLDTMLPVELRVDMKVPGAEDEEEASLDFGESEPSAKKLRKEGGVSKKRIVSDESEDDDLRATQTPSPQAQSSPTVATSTSSEALWTINWDQYVRDKRHRLCVTYCHSRMGGLAGTVCEVLLQHSMKTERDCTTKQSAPMVLDLLFQKLSTMPGAVSITLENMKRLLELMVQYNILHCNVFLGADQKYSVNIGTVLDNLKQKTIHNIVCEKYGVQAGRIIEVLRHHKYVEQQAISDCAIVPAREAREKLYSLFQDKWVNYYEVSKSGSNSYNPSSTVYLWYYNNADGFNNSCNRTLINRLYMVIYKLAVRYAHEIETGRTLVEVGQDTNSNPSTVGASGTNVDTVELLQLRLNRLQRSIFEVADTMFLFEL